MSDLRTESDARCPRCFSLFVDEDWTIDPLFSEGGSAYDFNGEDYVELIVKKDRLDKGFVSLDQVFITELQTNRQELEIEVGIADDDITTFSPVTSPYFLFDKRHIEELRESTEKILTASGQSLEDYLNADENGVYRQRTEEDTYQTDWFDADLNYGHIDVQHIEDLRKHLYLQGPIYEFYDGDDGNRGSRKLTSTVVDDLPVLSETGTVPISGLSSVAMNRIAVTSSYFYVLDDYIKQYNKTTGDFIKNISIPGVNMEGLYMSDIFAITENSIGKLIVVSRTSNSDVADGTIKVYKLMLDDDDWIIDDTMQYDYDSSTDYTVEKDITTPQLLPSACDGDYVYILEKTIYIKQATNGVYYNASGNVQDDASGYSEFIWDEPTGHPVRDPVDNNKYYGRRITSTSDLVIEYRIRFAYYEGNLAYFYVPSDYTGWAGYWSDGDGHPSAGSTTGSGEDEQYYPIFQPQLTLRKISIANLSNSETIDLLNTHTSDDGDEFTHFGTDINSNIAVSAGHTYYNGTRLALTARDGYLYLGGIELITSDGLSDRTRKNVSVFTFDINGSAIARTKIVGNLTKVAENNVHINPETEDSYYDELACFFSPISIFVSNNALILEYGFYMSTTLQKNFTYISPSAEEGTLTTYNIDDFVLYGNSDIIAGEQLKSRALADYDKMERSYPKYYSSSYFLIDHSDYIAEDITDIPAHSTWEKSTYYNYDYVWTTAQMSWVMK